MGRKADGRPVEGWAAKVDCPAAVPHAEDAEWPAEGLDCPLAAGREEPGCLGGGREGSARGRAAEPGCPAAGPAAGARRAQAVDFQSLRPALRAVVRRGLQPPPDVVALLVDLAPLPLSGVLALPDALALPADSAWTAVLAFPVGPAPLACLGSPGPAGRLAVAVESCCSAGARLCRACRRWAYRGGADRS